jgi:hypothetical protein
MELIESALASPEERSNGGQGTCMSGVRLSTDVSLQRQDLV